MKTKPSTFVDITIFGHDGKRLDNVKVTIKRLDRDESRSINFDNERKVYRDNDINPGHYLIKAESNGFESQEHSVDITHQGLKDTFILGHKNMPFYYRGKIKVPFDPPKDLLGVLLKPSITHTQEQELQASAIQLGLTRIEVSEQIHSYNVRIFRLPSNVTEVNKKEIQRTLSENVSVSMSGPLIRLDEESAAFLTNELVAKFKPQTSRKEITDIANQFNLDVVRNIPYAGNAVLLRSREYASYDLLDINDKIANIEIVEFAEPNLVATVVLDDINPLDFLYSSQWYIPLVNLPGAWEALRTQFLANAKFSAALGGPGDFTFGSEHIVIAVMDFGIESQTVNGITTPRNPDFQGSVTSGASKVYKFYDFIDMVDNNDAPKSNTPWHGTCCAGVASALAFNSSVNTGEYEGISGAAPNCRLMGLIYPAGSEIEFSDAYVWAAGFDPQSSKPNFPQPISPGADIITNSFGVFVGAPISGLMSSCFDYLTSYGRNGKGVVLFFSVGNQNKYFQLERPWAAYEKTIAVAASTNNDVKASYSNFGDGIDVCAPSSDGTNITTTYLVAQGDAAGHTGGSFDYTKLWGGGTSSSTALTAGVGALILSTYSDLYWYDVRTILRETAIKIDPDNVGIWKDINGLISTAAGYQGPYYSHWYGYGRIDALGAVQWAIPELDLDKWAAVLILIIGGATRGGGGIGIGPSGGPHPIDPHGPIARLSKYKRDILIGLAATEMASIVNNNVSRREIEIAGLNTMSNALEGLRESLAERK